MVPAPIWYIFVTMTVAYGHTTLNMSAASGLASWMGDCLGIPGAVSFFTTTCMSFVETSDHPVTHQEVDQLRLLLVCCQMLHPQNELPKTTSIFVFATFNQEKLSTVQHQHKFSFNMCPQRRTLLILLKRHYLFLKDKYKHFQSSTYAEIQVNSI